MAEKRPGNSQGLNPRALRAKRARDLAAANRPDREEKRAENQTFVDAEGNKGQRSDSDIHHTSSGTQRRVKTAYNRASHSRDEVKT